MASFRSFEISDVWLAVNHLGTCVRGVYLRTFIICSKLINWTDDCCQNRKLKKKIYRQDIMSNTPFYTFFGILRIKSTKNIYLLLTNLSFLHVQFLNTLFWFLYKIRMIRIISYVKKQIRCYYWLIFKKLFQSSLSAFKFFVFIVSLKKSQFTTRNI